MDETTAIVTLLFILMCFYIVQTYIKIRASMPAPVLPTRCYVINVRYQTLDDGSTLIKPWQAEDVLGAHKLHQQFHGAIRLVAEIQNSFQPKHLGQWLSWTQSSIRIERAMNRRLVQKLGGGSNLVYGICLVDNRWQENIIVKLTTEQNVQCLIVTE